MASPKPEQLGETYFYDSVGVTLRKRRRQLELTLAQVSRETRIQRKYLEAIEHNDWQRIPHTVHILGFIRQYAKLLGLDSQVASAKYLLERGPILSEPGKRGQHRTKPAIVGSRILMRVGIGALLLVVVIYLGLQLSILAAPPPLDIKEPPADLQTNALSITVSGQTASSASVTVNGAGVPVDDGGNFTASVNLSDGLNVIDVEARNRAGRVSTAQRSILVNP